MKLSPVTAETIGPEQTQEEASFVFQTKTTAGTPPSPAKNTHAEPSDLYYFTHPPDQAGSRNPQEALPDYGRAYFHQMLTQYWTFPTNDADPAACVHFNLQAIGVIYGLIQKYKSGTLTWEDLYELETALLRVMPEAMLRSQAWTFRARYKEIAPAAHFREYAQSKAAVKKEAVPATETLRAELETLLGEMQKYRTFVPEIGTGNANIPGANASWLAAGTLTAGIVFLLLHFVPLASGAALALTLLPIFAGGALGGLFSLQGRRQASIARKMALLDQFQSPPFSFHRGIALLTGAFSAALLFFAFRSHALQGIVFPQADRAALTHPFTFAVLIAWSFCAGFAERFVPQFFHFWKHRFSR